MLLPTKRRRIPGIMPYVLYSFCSLLCHLFNMLPKLRYPGYLALFDSTFIGIPEVRTWLFRVLYGCDLVCLRLPKNVVYGTDPQRSVNRYLQ